MRLETAPQKAEDASTQLQASRLYNSIEHELELGDYEEAGADAGEEALSILEQRFPGVRTSARNVTGAPQLSRSAGRRLSPPASGGSGRRSSREGHSRRSSGGRSTGGGGGRSSSTRRSSSSGVSPQRVVERAAGFTGGDVADAIITGLRLVIVAGLAYQVLQPKGAGAFQGILGGLGKGVRLIVDPVDPLQPSKPLSGSGKSGHGVLGSVAAGVNAAVPGPAGTAGPAGATGDFSRVSSGFRPLSGPPGTAGPAGALGLATGPRGSHVKQPAHPLALTFVG